jgi:hypothetical protein
LGAPPGCEELGISGDVLVPDEPFGGQFPVLVLPVLVEGVPDLPVPRFWIDGDAEPLRRPWAFLPPVAWGLDCSHEPPPIVSGVRDFRFFDRGKSSAPGC